MAQDVIHMPPLTEQIAVISPPSLASILIPCAGMIEYTRLLVPSLLRNTRPPFELIFIDVGSLDGTAEYLAGIADGVQARVEVVRTPTDLDIQEACREALHQARGQYVVLLNNDTVVPPFWLDQLLALAKMSDTIGMIGPMSNYAAPPQLVLKQAKIPGYLSGNWPCVRMRTGPSDSSWSP